MSSWLAQAAPAAALTLALAGAVSAQDSGTHGSELRTALSDTANAGIATRGAINWAAVDRLVTS